MAHNLVAKKDTWIYHRYRKYKRKAHKASDPLALMK